MSKLSKNMEDFYKEEQLHEFTLQELLSATNGFNKNNIIGEGGYGKVYKGVSKNHARIAVKRLDPSRGQGDHEFKKEIRFLSKYKHKNIVSLLGFCVEEREKILVYKFESNGSLDKHLIKEDLNWIQRLQICLGAARGLAYLHDDNSGFRNGIYHRDVKSANILLDDKWKPKISDFGLSREGSMNSFVISKTCGTHGYIDPWYLNAGYLSKKSDVYSFGVVLWEVICGTPVYTNFITSVQIHYRKKTLDKIIPSCIYKQINPVSLVTFTEIAYQCLKSEEEPPTMKDVVERLRVALQSQQAQKIVLKVLLDCEGCAEKVRKCLKGVKGVEKVIAICGTDMVIVTGNIANPSELVQKVKEKISRRNVELLSPSTEETKKSKKRSKKPEQEEPAPKQEEKTEEPVRVISKQCEFCAQDTQNSIIKPKGYKKTNNKTMIGDYNPIPGDGADPSPLEENQWLWALQTFGLYALFTCYLVLMSICYLGKRVHRMVMHIYEIPDPQSDDRPLPQDSSINEQSPQKSLP